MATENLQIRITAEMAQIRAALQSLQGQLEKARDSGGKIGSETARGITQLNQKLSSTTRIVAGFAASIGASMSIAGLIKASDEAGFIGARLQLATKNAKELGTAQKALFDIAQRTRSSLSTTVDLYARIERSTRDIGLNQATVLQLTETISKTSALSGGGPAVEAAIQQFGQLLSSGDLGAAAQELGSIQEQAPRLAQALVDGLKKLGYEGSGSLKKLVSEGGVPLNDLLRALVTQIGTIDTEFAKIPPSISGGFTKIRNALVQYLSTSQQAGTAARSFADALGKIAEHLPAILDGLIRLGPAVLSVYLGFKLWPLIAVAVGIAQAAVVRFTAQLALMTPAMIAATAQARALSASMVAVGPASAIGASKAVTALGLIKGAFSLLIAGFVGFQIGTYLSEQFLKVRLAGIAMVRGLLVVWETLKGGIRQIGVTLREVFVSAFNYVIRKASDFYAAMGKAAGKLPGVGSKASAYFNDMAKSLAGSKLESEGIAAAFNRVYKETEAAKDNIKQSMDELADAEIAAEAAKTSPPPPDGDVGIPDPKLDPKNATAEAAALAQTNAQLVQDAVQRSLEQLDRLYEDGKLSIKDYFAEKQRLELEGIDAAISAAQAERAAAKDAGAVADANAKIIILMRDRKKVAIDAIDAQQKAEEEYVRQLGALQIRLLMAQGETGKATWLQVEDELKDFIASERTTQIGRDLARKVINMEAFKAQLDQVQTKVSEAMGRFNSTEAATGAQVDAGILTQDDASDRVNQQRLASLKILQEQRAELVKIRDDAAAAGDALTMQGAADALVEIDGNIAQLSIDTNSLLYKATQVLGGAMSQLFSDLADGSKSASEAMRDFVLNFVKGMAQMAAQALATLLVLQLLDAIYPGAGKAAAATMNAGKYHTGGTAGSSASTMRIPALAFAGAPRYHAGGVAGLKSDELPAVLRRGEIIRTREQENALQSRMSSGQATQVPVRNIIIFNDDQLAEAMAGSAGERVVINHVRRNGGGTGV